MTVDWHAFLQRVGGDLTLGAEVAGLFLGRAPDLIGSLMQARRADDANAMRFAAHALKGSIKAFDLPQAESLAEQLERIAAQGTCAGAEAPLAELAQAVTTLEREVRAWLAGSAA